MRSLIHTCALLGLLLPAAARAQAVDAHFFRPSLFSGGLFTVDTGASPRKWQPSFRFTFDHASAPLRLTFPQDGCDKTKAGCLGTQEIIEHAQAFHLQAQLGLTSWLELALDIPLVRHTLNGSGDAAAPAGFDLLRPAVKTNVETPNAAPLDVRVGLKVRLIDRAGFALALALEGTLPFGDEEVLAGDAGFTLRPRLLASFSRGPLLVGLNAGYRIREQSLLLWDDPQTTVKNRLPLLAMDDEVTFGAGVAYRFHPVIGAGLEVYGAVPVGSGEHTVESTSVSFPGDPGCPTTNTSPCVKVTRDTVELPRSPVTELLGGVIITPLPGLDLAAGAGLGLSGEERRASLRVFFGVTWTPGVQDLAQVDPEDRDGDGVLGLADLCPNKAEDRDGFQDGDGCPDPDNDDDGVVDGKDRCPNKAEDEDGFQDDDGCPDLDNDGDGVPDNRDGCPAQKEDKDDFEDGDGCPEPDNDGDGVPDHKDGCPDEAETPNNFQDSDGCPDTAPPQ